MCRLEIRITGYGGQGVIRAAVILANAARLFCNREVVQTQSYGPEARGGVCKADIIVSEDEVDYPVIEHPDILIVMSNEVYDLYHSGVKASGTIIIDSTLIPRPLETRIITYKIPATEIAKMFCKPILANIILLGVFTSTINLVEEGSMKKALSETFPPEYREMNLIAFEEGYNYGLKQRKNGHRKPLTIIKSEMPFVESSRPSRTLQKVSVFSRRSRKTRGTLWTST